LDLRSLSKLSLDEGRSQRCAGFGVERIAQINDFAASFTCLLPRLRGMRLFTGKESEVRALKLFWRYLLNECRLFANRFQLAEGFFVIQQFHVVRREAPLT